MRLTNPLDIELEDVHKKPPGYDTNDTKPSSSGHEGLRSERFQNMFFGCKIGEGGSGGSGRFRYSGVVGDMNALDSLLRVELDA